MTENSLTVDWITNKGRRCALQRLELDLVDLGLVVEALAVHVELKSAGHGDSCQPALRCFITMPDAQKWRI